MNTHLNISPSNESNLDFVVHNYSLFQQTQNYELLAIVHGLICAASTRSKGWRNAGEAPLKLSTSTYILQYYQPPIITTDEQRIGPRVIREWGKPLQNDEDVFVLNDLDDFASTDFTFLFVQQNPLPGVGSPIADDKQLNFDLGPLHNVVPQPHIHPSLHATLSKPIKITHYKRRKPIPIPPHTLPLPLSSPHARSAWIVPIRGSLPWVGCTSAVILDSSGKLPCPSQKSEEPITWTHHSLVSFWAFLLNLRVTGNVGPIGLSFHAARPPLPQGGSSYNTISPALGNQVISESHATTNPRSTATPAPPRPPLLSVDHVKIYHEASTAMHVRNALHVWAYHGDTSKETGVTHEKIRLLKGARFVLVDELAKGILIS